MNHDPTAVQKQHWNEVASLGCVVCGGMAQIAHVAGKPSITERMQEPKAKGLSTFRRLIGGTARMTGTRRAVRSYPQRHRWPSAREYDAPHTGCREVALC
jgi:hypothetical protein